MKFDCEEALKRVGSSLASSEVLLLQGPVGPFFKSVRDELEGIGFVVKRVHFNSGDSLFGYRKDDVRFKGTLDEWEVWLRFELLHERPGCILLFGSGRPIHKVARFVAASYGIPVVSLEEGYLRSGYITAELGGNNQHSQMASWVAKGLPQAEQAAALPPLDMRPSSLPVSFWATLYYCHRDIFSSNTDSALYHRRREHIIKLILSWSAHMAARTWFKISELPMRSRLNKFRQYILVPLQVSSDSQIQQAARGWTAHSLVDACLNALKRTEPHQRIVFKLHPLERDNFRIAAHIRQTAKKIGMRADRVQILHSGRIGKLAADSSGMIVINSTSAFSALHHRVPLLVLGDAIYRHEDIVTVAETEQDIEDFFKLRHSKSSEKILEFFQAMKTNCLIPGDFYTAKGRKAAVPGIIKKIEALSKKEDKCQK